MQPVCNPDDNFQSHFHRRWGSLHDKHVRALAWLLTAPDLLDASAEQWQGRIARLDEGLLRTDLDGWLHALDGEPAALHAYLGPKPFVRLGRYAEKLLAFYLAQLGVLLAHGVQVREDHRTIGEFDFLLRWQERLVHWEFATKFYLLESSGNGHDADYFVGPNLADTLGAKLHKIFDRQLKLSEHPAARRHLPGPIANAQALVKGWLFYHEGRHFMRADGTSTSHCRGFWLSLEDVEHLRGQHFAILPRLDWLAPARLTTESVFDRETLRQTLQNYFAQDRMPIMLAVLQVEGNVAREIERGFIVPADWQTRAAYRTKPLSH
jgi:hypothetical protein